MRASTTLALASASLVAGLSAAAVPTAAPTAASTMRARPFGAYSDPKAPTNETASLLIQALTKPYNATLHICVGDVFAYETQVVAGVNYRFHVRGAEIAADQTLGWCTPTNASQQHQVEPNQNFTIVVLDQPWLKVLEVRSIRKA